MKKEKSGLAYTTLELVQAEVQQGHEVFVREPTDKEGMPGELLYGREGLDCDVESIHSQLPLTSYVTKAPKFMWMHGEPLSSVGNGVSMKAIIDLSSKVDAFICMRPEELSVWSALKRTWLVTKGIDLERFKPVEVKEKLSGEPAVLYAEHWRGQRNPLYPIIAMQKVWQKLPKARLHLFNCTDKRMYETFSALSKHAKLWPFLRSLNGPVPDDKVNDLYNRSDIVISGLYPLYARSIEAFGAGKAFIGPGYTRPDYPWHCTLDPDSMAQAILDCWADYHKVDYRQWALDHHNVLDTAREAVSIYQRYL